MYKVKVWYSYEVERMNLQQARRLGWNGKASTSRSKMGNIPTVYNGRQYQSKKESVRAYELDLLLKAGKIVSWEPQYKIPIEHNGIKICSYYADFKVVLPDGTTEFEDTKGFKTPMYKLKKKLVKAFHGIDIKEL